MLGRLLERAPDAAERLSLLADSLDGAVAAVFRQVAMNRFEHAVHTDRRESGELPPERFAELWLETQTDLLGDAVELDDDYGLWWSYVPHFVDTPGYVYAYAYGHLLALSVYRRYEEEGEGFVPSYLELLRAGGSRPPEELAAIVGVDLSDPGFWSSGLDLIERQLEAAERAARGGRPALVIDPIEERIALPLGEVALAPPARRRGAAHRGGLREGGVPALLGRAVGERRGARARPRAPRRCAAPRVAGAGLRARAAEHRRRAGRRARAGHRLVARRRAGHGRQRRAQRRRASRPPRSPGARPSAIVERGAVART